MRHEALHIFPMILIGMAGITLLVLAWARPMPVSDRILTTCIGATGLFVALIRALLLRSRLAKLRVDRIPAEVKVKRKPY